MFQWLTKKLFYTLSIGIFSITIFGTAQAATPGNLSNIQVNPDTYYYGAGETSVKYEVYFHNENPLKSGDRVEITFPSDYSITNVDSWDVNFYSTMGSVNNISNVQLDYTNRKITFDVNIYDYKNGLDQFYAEIYDVDNPSTEGNYTITVQTLDAGNSIIDSGTGDITIANTMSYLYAYNGDSQREANTYYSYELTPYQDLQDNEWVRVYFPKNFDLSNTVVDYFGFDNANLDSYDNVFIDTINNFIELQVHTTLGSAGDLIYLDLDQVKNPSQGGTYFFRADTLDNTKNIKDTETYNISIDTPNTYSLDSVSLTSQLASASTTLSTSFYPSLNYQNNWTARLQFPEGTDLSNVTSGDVTVTNTNYTSPIVNVDDANDRIDIIPDGDSGGDLINVSVSNLVNPPNAGHNVLTIYGYDDTGFLQDIGSQGYDIINTGTITPFTVGVNDSTPSTNTTYHLVYTPPSSIADNWTVILDFDDDVDLSNFDYNALNDDLDIYGNNVYDPAYSDVTVDVPNSTITIVMNMPYGDSGNNNLEFYLYDINNPSAGGLKTVNITHKDAEGNVVDTGSGKFIIDGDLSVNPSSTDRSTSTNYDFSFTPTTAIDNNWLLEFVFPDDIDLSDIETYQSAYLSGTNIGGYSNINVDKANHKVTLTVDASSNSSGDPVYATLYDIINPSLGSNNTYTVTLNIYDDLSALSESIDGYFYIQPAGTTSPTVSLTDSTISNTSSYLVTYTPIYGLDQNWTIRVQFPPDTDLSNVTESTADIHLSGSGSPFDSPTITKNAGNGYIDIQLGCSSCSGGSGNSPISITIDNVINASTPGNYNLDITSYDNNNVIQDQGQGPYTLVTATPNQAPTAPSNLYVDLATNDATIGKASPVTLGGTSLEFSAQYNDPNTGDIANGYEIEIYSDSGLSTLVYQSGSKQAMSNTIAGNQSPELTAGGTLVDGQTYYWRVRFYDDDNTAGAWSDGTAHFTIDTSAPAITAATPADNATGVSTTPTFSYTIEDASSSPISTTLDVNVNGTPVIIGGLCQIGFSCTYVGTVPPTPNTLTFYFDLPYSLPLSSINTVDISIDDTVGNNLSDTLSFTTTNGNLAPSAPDNLFVNLATEDATTGNVSPAVLPGTNLEFSGRFNDPDAGDIANGYEIEVYSDASLTNLVYQSGSKQAMSNTTTGSQSPELTAGGTLVDGQTYYWRLRFYDDDNTAGAWSDGSAHFTIDISDTQTYFLGSGGGSSTAYSNEKTTTIGEGLKESAPLNENSTNTSTSNNTNQQSPTDLLTINQDACSYFLEHKVSQANKDIVNTSLQEYTSILEQYGVIIGKNATNFNPNDLVTRSEILRAVLQATCERYSFSTPSTKPFPDVETYHPDAIFIEAGKNSNVVSGYLSTGLFKPDTFITRAEALKVILEAVLVNVDSFDGPNHGYNDVNKSEWYDNYVRFAHQNKLIDDTPFFYPDSAADRKFIAKVLAKTLLHREVSLGTIPERVQNLETKNSHTSASDTSLVDITAPKDACDYFKSIQPTGLAYTDITDQATYSYVNALINYGVIFSKSSQFLPLQHVSRSEMLRLIIQASCENITLDPITGNPFPDVSPNHPDAIYIQAAKHFGIIQGYGDGLFRPDQDISRAEAIKIIIRTLIPNLSLESQSSTFEDVLPGTWFAPYISLAEEDGYLDHTSQLMRPMLSADRAFIAEILAKVLSKETKE